VDVRLIDGANRRIGVSVGGEQCPLRIGKDVHSFPQKRHSVHLGHALIRKQQSHALVPHLQLFQKAERFFRESHNHTVRPTILNQVAFDRRRRGVVVHSQQDWFCHDFLF
jgi:hypothetical protein